MLKLFVGKIDAELLKAVAIKVLKAENVKDACHGEKKINKKETKTKYIICV